MSRSRCVVGRVARVFGIRGELVCEPGAFGAGPFAPNQRLWLVTEDATQPFEIVAVRPHRGAVRVGLAGIATPEAAAPLVGARIEA
ncbi:MAG: hypothetical protein ACREM2_10120, partial [Vulcanimicrobiaceae bacterium]